MGIGLWPGGGVFVATDVHYLPSGGARAAAVVSADAGFSRLVADRVEVVPEVAPYRPGEFYLRELPPLRAVLGGLAEMTLLVVDGFADLDPHGRPGLGAHAHAEFGCPGSHRPASGVVTRNITSWWCCAPWWWGRLASGLEQRGRKA